MVIMTTQVYYNYHNHHHHHNNILTLYVDPHGDHGDPGVLHRGQRSRQADVGEASRDTLPCLGRSYTTSSRKRKNTLSRPTFNLSWRSIAIATMSNEKNNLFLTEESSCGIGRLFSLQRLYLVQQQLLNYIWWDSSQHLRWNILTKRCPWFFCVS